MDKSWLFLLAIIATVLGSLAVASIVTSGWKFLRWDLISLDDFRKLKKRLDKERAHLEFLLNQVPERAEPKCKSKANIRFF